MCRPPALVGETHRQAAVQRRARKRSGQPVFAATDSASRSASASASKAPARGLVLGGASSPTWEIGSPRGRSASCQRARNSAETGSGSDSRASTFTASKVSRPGDRAVYTPGCSTRRACKPPDRRCCRPGTRAPLWSKSCPPERLSGVHAACHRRGGAVPRRGGLGAWARAAVFVDQSKRRTPTLGWKRTAISSSRRKISRESSWPTAAMSSGNSHSAPALTTEDLFG